MDNWNLLAGSATRNAYLDMLVNGIRTLFIRTGDGIFFNLAVPLEDIREICVPETAKLLAVEPSLAGRVIVGRFIERNENYPSGSSPQMEGDRKLNEHVRQSVEHFCSLVDNFGRWPSFSRFLQEEIDYDPKNMPLESQVSLEYWWLVGKTEGAASVHQTSLYQEGAGIFIRPDNIIPIFTSSLYADMASKNYSYSPVCETRLVPVKIPCPSCYLSGLGGHISSEILHGAMLNEQWRIRFITCDEQNYTAPTHFYMADSEGEEYALAGCPDRGARPHWVLRRWGHDEKWFPKKCKPLPWVMDRKSSA